MSFPNLMKKKKATAEGTQGSLGRVRGIRNPAKKGEEKSEKERPADR